MREFSLKVFPVSLGLFKLNFEVGNVLILAGNKSLISFNFPLLFVPIRSCLIFFLASGNLIFPYHICSYGKRSKPR